MSNDGEFWIAQFVRSKRQLIESWEGIETMLRCYEVTLRRTQDVSEIQLHISFVWSCDY